MAQPIKPVKKGQTASVAVKVSFHPDQARRLDEACKATGASGRPKPRALFLYEAGMERIEKVLGK